MKEANVTIIGQQTYPQWEEISLEMQGEVMVYHEILKNRGYEIKAANIACKADYLYWVLKDENGYYLELYGEQNKPMKKE